MDADKGTVLATVDIGRAPDGCGFDPSKGLAYSSNGGDGTVTAVGEGEPGKFKVVATIPTQAERPDDDARPQDPPPLPLAPPPPAPARRRRPAAGQGGRRGIVPGSFVIVVVGD